MYEEFFGLSERPFFAVPNPECFVPLGSVQEVLDDLVHCVTQSRGVGVLTSAEGLGKTLICKRLITQLKEQCLAVYVGSLSSASRGSLLQSILFEIGIDYVGLSDDEARLKVMDAARNADEQGQFLLLVLDDAHTLTPSLLQEVRTLAEYAPDGSSVIRVVLSGNFELEEALADPAQSALNQRIGCHVHLDPYALEQSAELVCGRLQWAGAEDVLRLLTEEALELICRASDGDPRCLCQLADHSFLMAFSEEQCPVTADLVAEALNDVKELPLHWNDVESSISSDDEAIATTTGTQLSRVDGGDEAEEFLFPEDATGEMDEVAQPAFVASDFGADPIDDLNGALDEDIEYAVIEVGRIDATPEDEQAATDQLWTDSAEPAVTEQEVDAVSEIVVVDHFAELDRLQELPEELRAAALERIAQSDQSPIESSGTESGLNAPLANRAIDDPERSQSLDESILETVEELRQEILEAIDHSDGVEEPTVEGPKWDEYDIVEPSDETNSFDDAAASGDQHVRIDDKHVLANSNNDSTDECGSVCDAEVSDVAENATATGNSDSHSDQQPDADTTERFAQLFSRLRRRRQRIQSECETD